MWTIAFRVSFILIILISFVSLAHAYQIYESGAFLSSSDLGADSLTYLDGGTNDFAGSGVGLTYKNELDSNGYGKLIWHFTNNTSATLSDVSLFGFVDAEIVEKDKSFVNEYGEYVAITGSGSGDVNPDSWEIDEPGYVFGDIYDNLLLGSLDNTNAIPHGLEDDVSLALGFELGDILNGQAWTMTLTISDIDIGGLYHGNVGGSEGAYVNGSVVLDNAATVIEPPSMLLMVLGMFVIVLVRHQRLTKLKKSSNERFERFINIIST